MEEINSLLTFMLVIIPLGAGARVGYCLLVTTFDEEDAKTMKTRARNALVFAAVAECILPLIKLLLSYFGK